MDRVGPESRLRGARRSAPPRDGLVVLSPGVLQHFVHPVRGGEQRISLSFNLQAT
ncbi:MAG: hypothetical protein KF718_15580 [Polyangiaceae bacterium]|nr:hypothetical protein [Polyangiaceae bacterium]